MADEVKEVKPSLIRKLCEAGAAVGWIEKGGYNEFHKYGYAREADIVSKLRVELYKRQVFIFPHIIKNERVPVEVTSNKWVDGKPTQVVRQTALTNVDIEWTFVDGESGEKWTVMVPGIGEDSVDKGLYKAFTGSEKYLLMKSFLLPTGDDPEADSEEDRQAAKDRGKSAAQTVGARKVEEMREKAKKAGKPLPEAPTPQLCVYPVGEDLYEITGEGDIMNDFKEALLLYGKRVGKTNRVTMTGNNLESFKLVFCREHNGVLTYLKSAQGAEAAKGLAEELNK